MNKNTQYPDMSKPKYKWIYFALVVVGIFTTGCGVDPILTPITLEGTAKYNGKSVRFKDAIATCSSGKMGTYIKVLFFPIEFGKSGHDWVKEGKGATFCVYPTPQEYPFEAYPSIRVSIPVSEKNFQHNGKAAQIFFGQFEDHSFTQGAQLNAEHYPQFYKNLSIDSKHNGTLLIAFDFSGESEPVEGEIYSWELKVKIPVYLQGEKVW